MRVPYEAKMPHGGNRFYGGEPTFGVLNEGRFQITYKGKNYRIHRMVCEAFAGAAPFPGAVVMHLDENAENNRAENLAWGTQKENMAAPGFMAYVRRRGFCAPKINKDQARHIKYGAESNASLARKYSISVSTVSNIRQGKTWRHI